MTLKDIRIVVQTFPYPCHQWMVYDHIVLADKPNERLWIGGGGTCWIDGTWKDTTSATDKDNNRITIIDKETPLCVNFLGKMMIDNKEDLKKAWLNREKLYQQFFGK